MSRRNSLIFSAIIGTAATVGSTSLAGASTLGVDNDFTSNSGAWQFGQFSPNTTTNFVAFKDYLPTGTDSVGGLGAGTGLQEWSTNTSGASPYNGSDPNVIFNSGTSDYTTTSQYGFIDFQAKTVNLGPYLGPTVVQYTVPTDGQYNITSMFQTVQQANTAPTEYVYIPGMTTYTKQLVDNNNAQFGSKSYYNVTNVSLIAGQTIDFVAWGTDTDNKTTQLAASVDYAGPLQLGSSPTVSTVPLPESAKVGFATLGAVGLAFGVKKRLARRSQIV